MLVATKNLCAAAFLTILLIVCASSAAIAQDRGWHVSKSSGEVTVTGAGSQPAPVNANSVLKPGDTIRTGQTGRVLLVRGEESILISANSVIAIPSSNSDGMSTTILQKAGSILFEVEKRNVKHFEVETPYLAAVVKGTQFRVTVSKTESTVEVFRGQVEVTDFRSGQHAQVMPDQIAKASVEGAPGLSLSGSGILGSVESGTPRNAPVGLDSKEEASASDNKAIAKQTKSAALQDGVSTFFVPSAASSASENVWTSSLNWVGRSVGFADKWWDSNDDDGLLVSIPLGVGFLVALFVTVQRRWQRRTFKPQ